jgi:DNA-directed RNA polymerase sigma subunit (sigma70/sigma32)
MESDPDDYEEKLQRLLDSLSLKDAESLRKILASLPGASFDELSKRFQEKRAQIQQIEKRALNKLKRRPDDSQ